MICRTALLRKRNIFKLLRFLGSSDPILSATYTRTNKTEVDEDEKYWSRYTDATSNVKDSSTAEEEACIPCENCGILFPISCIELHEVTLRPFLISSTLFF